MTEQVLLDTDIGSDIDDALCLAYLLAQPDCHLLGVTTVTGESIRRAMMADALCRVAGREVPVYPGVERPLLLPQQQPTAPQARALANWDHRTDFPTGEAVNFLRRTIRDHPGAVTLLAIGPLTNIGLLFAMDPQVPALLKRLVIMGGHYAHRLGDAPLAEWNIRLDPHAAAIVFRSPVDIQAVGLEVTRQVAMDAAAVRARLDVPLLRPVRDFADIYFEHADRIVFHDPLAALTIFDDRVCTFERGQVTVELSSERRQDFTHWQPGEGRHRVAATVDSGRFFQQFFAAFA